MSIFYIWKALDILWVLQEIKIGTGIVRVRGAGHTIMLLNKGITQKSTLATSNSFYTNTVLY